MKIDLISFHSFDTKNGKLMPIYDHLSKNESKVPFLIKKVLVITDVKNNDVRGGHTHHKTIQVLTCIKGSCAVTLDDGKGHKEQIKLAAGGSGVLLEPYVWHTMENFSDDAILLVVASEDYDEKDYIRSYDEFKKCIDAGMHA